MLINSLLTPKNKLQTVTTQDTLSTALSIMEDYNHRCIPILDKTNTIYRGNIYRSHIYKHIVNGGSLSDSVTTLIKNATKFILEEDSFFNLHFTLNDLPYISVLNSEHHFLGIIYHKDFMSMLSDAWRLSNSSYAMTIELSDDSHDFQKVIKLIKKFTDFNGLITFDREHFSMKKRIVVTLPHEFSRKNLEKLIIKLKKKNYTIIEVEDLNEGV